MWVESIVSLQDFQSLAAELLPVRVQLGGVDSEHYLFLSAASEVSLVEDRGLRIVCNAQIRWPVLGMDLPINVDRLTVMLEPSVPNEGGELFVSVQLEHADVAWVPSVVDTKIVSAINEALKKRKADLSWSFARSLSHDFGLPEMLQPLRALQLKAAWGKVRVTSEAMVLVLSFHAHAVPTDTAHAPPLTRAPRPALVPAFPALNDRPGPAVVALGTAAALVSSYFVARLAYGWLSGSAGRRRFAY